MSPPNPPALAAATTIADRLADPPVVGVAGRRRRSPQSLANGAAGVALLHIERARARQGDWATAHAWLAAAVGEDLSAGPNASLFFGVPALAFVTHAAIDRPGKYGRAQAALHAATIALTRTRLTTLTRASTAGTARLWPSSTSFAASRVSGRTTCGATRATT